MALWTAALFAVLAVGYALAGRPEESILFGAFGLTFLALDWMQKGGGASDSD